MLNTVRLAPDPPPKFVGPLVNDGLGKRLGLSCVLLKALTGVVNAPVAFHVILTVAPEAVAVTGELETLRDWAKAAATSLGPLLTGCPLQIGFVLGPKQATAVNPLTLSDTVPESGMASCATVLTSCSDQPVVLLWYRS